MSLDFSSTTLRAPRSLGESAKLFTESNHSLRFSGIFFEATEESSLDSISRFSSVSRLKA
ncbi:Uncharacterised protein [Vibrio cholerae]|nr:Uncharacterised protein [Vibrio cholerae]